MIEALAPGKMIVLGEYAVLEGAPALVYAVNRLARVQVTRLKGNICAVSAPGLNVQNQPFVFTATGKVRFDPHLDPRIKNRLHLFSRLFEEIWPELLPGSTTSSAVELDLVTDDFYSQTLHSKLGFGSSAALTAAMTFALAGELPAKLSKLELFRLALQGHRLAQGNMGSGIDVAASCYGGALEYRMTKSSAGQPAPENLTPWTDLPVAVIWSGQSASTPQMVQSVSALKQKEAGLYEALMKKLSALSEAGLRAYRAQDLPVFLEIINAFESALDELGTRSATPIISDQHRELAHYARQQGAAYKPSGAGGGDIGLLFAPSQAELKRICENIASPKLTVLDVALFSKGVEVKTN